MDGVRRPVGDLPPRVYWFRRALVFGGLILAIIVVYFLITSPRGAAPSSPSTSNSPAASISPDPSASPGANASADRACTSDDVTLTTVPTPFSVSAGTLPMFEVTATMVGSTPCRLSTLADGTELSIRSGNDPIFSSLNCPDDATFGERELILQPGSGDEMIQLTWNRQRNAEGCPANLATPAAGYYKAKVSIQGIAADEAQFELK